MSAPSRARLIAAAFVLQQAGYADVAKFLLARDKKQAHPKRAPRATRVDVAKDGKRVRGGKAYINLANPDVKIEETT